MSTATDGPICSWPSPQSGQLSVYLQQPDGSLAPPKTFPTLAGVSQLAAADWNGDGKPEIFLLSRDENAVGVTQLDKNGRLPFPTLIPLDGKPLVMAVGALKPGAKPSLCVIVDQDGQRSLVTRTADGKMRTQKLSENFKSNPTTLAFQDVNQDGRADLVVLIPYEKIKVLLQKSGGDFDEVDVDPPGGAIEQPWLASADVDGDGKPELLLPQKNFLRAVVLEQQTKTPGSTNQPDWVFRVKDQINGAADNSRLVGAAAVRERHERNSLDFPARCRAQGVDVVRARRSRRLAGVRNVALPVSDFTGLQPVALGGTTSRAWLSRPECRGLDAAGGRGLGIDRTRRLRNTHQGRLFERRGLRRFEQRWPQRPGVPGNGQELPRPGLFDAHHKLVPANRWQVFEERTFRGRRNDFPNRARPSWPTSPATARTT